MSKPPRRIPPTERFAAVLAGLVLLVATGFFVMLAVEFVAAASGSDFSPWASVPLPDDVPQRVALLAAAVIVGVLLMIAGLRLRDPLLRVDVPGGRVTVRSHAIERELAAAMAVDPDVLRTEARVRSRHGELHAQVDIVARPLADETRLRGEAGDRMQRALCDAAGLTCPRPRIEVRCARVRELGRYLP